MSTTFARVRNVKIGDAMKDVAEHKHDGFGWHWASAGHRDDGAIHKEANAFSPNWGEGVTPTAAQVKLYDQSVKREVINQIPSKAKPKTEKAEPEEESNSDGATQPRNRGRQAVAANA